MLSCCSPYLVLVCHFDLLVTSFRIVLSINLYRILIERLREIGWPYEWWEQRVCYDLCPRMLPLALLYLPLQQHCYIGMHVGHWTLSHCHKLVCVCVATLNLTFRPKFVCILHVSVILPASNYIPSSPPPSLHQASYVFHSYPKTLSPFPTISPKFQEGASEFKKITMLFNMSGCGLSNIVCAYYITFYQPSSRFSQDNLGIKSEICYSIDLKCSSPR